MIRQKRRIALRFPIAAEAHLVNGGSRLTPGSLVVHVHPNRLFARWTPNRGFDDPPVFHGRVQRDADQLTVTGTIREARAVAVLPAALLLVAACGVAMVVVGVADSDARTLLLILGAVLAILFTALFIGSLSRRRPRFRLQAGELEYGIDTYLRTGTVSRPV